MRTVDGLIAVWFGSGTRLALLVAAAVLLGA